MTDKQPEACEVPLLELLESIPNNVRVRAYTEDGMSTTHYPVVHLCRKAAAELRRLHEVNAELMKALAAALDLPFEDDVAWFEWRDKAETALAKATGEQQ